MKHVQKYGIGEQNFKNLIEDGCVYVDKTRYIEKLLTSGSKYYFLARPRRFGKSLFLSSVEYFFEGRRDLFKGLYIDSKDELWNTHPVLRLDLNRERYAEPGKLEIVINFIFREWEEKYGIDCVESNPPQRFSYILRKVYEKTGKRVVILVDEYDKPLVGNLNNRDIFEYYRSALASLYSNFKSSSEYIHLVCLTGVSRFSRLSVFSELNNLNDITFDPQFADVCGITIEESLKYLSPGISEFAENLNGSFEEACLKLRESYDGYRFTKNGSDCYNPWALMCALDKSEIANYWNETGMPTIVGESLKRIDADLEETFDCYCSEDELKGLDLLNPNPTALLYQTGYLTIKDYITESKIYHLGIPNKEVKTGLFNTLLPYYVKVKSGVVNNVVATLKASFVIGNPEKAMKCLQSYFSGIDYAMKMDDENNFHNAFFLLIDLIGLNAKTESHTSSGRIDIEVLTSKFIYIIELKYDHTAEEALNQIKEKNYALKYGMDSRKIFLIGASFSSETRTIGGWKIEAL